MEDLRGPSTAVTPEPRSSVSLRENAKGEVQIEVKVYADDDGQYMSDTADVAYQTYIKLRQKLDAGVPKVKAKGK